MSNVQPGLSTAYGVGRTSELTLFPSASLPSRSEAAAQGAQGKTLPIALPARPSTFIRPGCFWRLESSGSVDPFQTLD